MGCAKDEPVPTQGDIAGKVTDSNDGSPISGANVSLSGDQRSTTTSSDGNFTFKSLVAGSYSVTAIKNGYVATSRTVTVTPEKTVNADIQIKKDLPRVSVQEVVFNKDNIAEEKSITLTNTREGDMSYTLQPSKSWIKTTPSSGTIPEGNQAVVKINIEYGAIEFGTYNEFIVLNVGQASVSIPINITYDAPQFTVTVTAGDGGEVDTDGGIYAQGTELTLTATPFQGYAFNKWSNGSPANPYTFTVTQNVTLNATFTVLSYDVIANVEGEGTVEQTLLTSGSIENYVYNSTIRLEAKPSPGWKFKEWTGDYVGEDNPIELTVDQEKEVTANFVRKDYILDVLTEGEGAVTEEVIVQPSNSYQYETEVRLTATPEAGWVFANWDGDASGTDNPLDVKITEATSIKAVFKRAQFNLDLTIVGEGEVNQEVVVAPTVTAYDYESVIKLTATPATGWGFSGYTGDLESSENPVEVVMTTNQSVTATFIELDTDGDGVTDPNDQCPGTEEGAEVDANGCSTVQKDTDGDGVNDAVDQCPDTPSDEEADTNGCSPSQKDSDNDGVNDAVDQCPDTPTGKEVDSTGCVLYLNIKNDDIPDEITVGSQLKISWETNYTERTVRVILKKYQSSDETILEEGITITDAEYVWLVDPNIDLGFYQLIIYDESNDNELDKTNLVEVVRNCEELPMQDSVFEEWLFDNGYDDLLDNKVDSCRMAEITEIISPLFSTRVDWAIFTNVSKIKLNFLEIGCEMGDKLIDLSVVPNLTDLEIIGVGGDNCSRGILKWDPLNLKNLKIDGLYGLNQLSETSLLVSKMPNLESYHLENVGVPNVFSDLNGLMHENLVTFIYEKFTYLPDLDLTGLKKLKIFRFSYNQYNGEIYISDNTTINLCGLDNLESFVLGASNKRVRDNGSNYTLEILISELVYNQISTILPIADDITLKFNICSNLDSDDDGLTDDLDLCENTPAGEAVDENGCSSSQKDSDNDGFTDNLDLCPETPAGETVDQNGCALSQKDSDGDGVNDDVDLCPDTENGVGVNEYGCPSEDTGLTIDINSVVGYGRYDNDLYKTIDGGITWSVINDDNFYEVEFISFEVGFGRYNEDLYVTSDGGESWDIVNDYYFENLTFVDENTGFSKWRNDIYKTTDGGLTFEFFSDLDGFDISFPNSDIGYSSGNDFYRINKYGESFKVNDLKLYDIDFVTGAIGYGTNYEDLYKTVDGGVSWNVVSDMNFNHLSFINEDIGFASDGRDLYRTEDGGGIWEKVNDIAFYNIGSFDFVRGTE